jgi:hypothetical protein
MAKSVNYRISGFWGENSYILRDQDPNVPALLATTGGHSMILRYFSARRAIVVSLLLEKRAHNWTSSQTSLKYKQPIWEKRRCWDLASTYNQQWGLVYPHLSEQTPATKPKVYASRFLHDDIVSTDWINGIPLSSTPCKYARNRNIEHLPSEL